MNFICLTGIEAFRGDKESQGLERFSKQGPRGAEDLEENQREDMQRNGREQGQLDTG